MNPLPVLLTVLLGGVAALDATPVAQTLLSQPLVTATLLGLAWGDLHTALQVGIVLQILAASTLPIGARTPEDYAVGGVVGAGVALALVSREHFLMMADASSLAGVFAGLVAASLGVPIVKWQRRRNEGLSRWAEAEIRGGREGALGAAQRAGVVLAFGAGVAYAALCLGLGVWLLGPFVGRHSLRLARAWEVAQPLWLGLGLAQLLHAFVRRRLVRAAAFGVTMLATWMLLIVSAR